MPQRKNNIYYIDFGSKYRLTNMIVKFQEGLHTSNTEGYLFFRNNEIATYTEEAIYKNLKDCNDTMDNLSKTVNKFDYKFFNVPYIIINYEEEYNTIVLDDTLIKFNYVDSISVIGDTSDITYEKAKRFDDTLVNVFFNEHEKYDIVSAFKNNSIFRAEDVDRIEAEFTTPYDGELDNLKSMLDNLDITYNIKREWVGFTPIYYLIICITDDGFKYYLTWKSNYTYMCDNISNIDINAIKQTPDYQQKYQKYLNIKQLL